MKRHKNIKHNNLKIFGINAAGIKSKLKSFDEVISRLKPHIWMVGETKLKPHETVTGGCLDEFQVYYLSRQNAQGVGVALGINKMLESTLISIGDEDIEVISVLVIVKTAYRVQENASKEKKIKFWDFIEE